MGGEREADRQTKSERQTDRQTYRRTDRQTDREADRQAGRQKRRQTVREPTEGNLPNKTTTVSEYPLPLNAIREEREDQGPVSWRPKTVK